MFHYEVSQLAKWLKTNYTYLDAVGKMVEDQLRPPDDIQPSYQLRDFMFQVGIISLQLSYQLRDFIKYFIMKSRSW